MSAFDDGHGDCYHLTGTKLRHWHRLEGDPFDLLRSAGLTVRPDDRYGFYHVTGPGVDASKGNYGGAGVIWTALSGKPDRYA